MSWRPFEVLAPAKINLFLELLARREDGYHAIETVVQAISLCDRIEIEPGPRGLAFSCSDPSLPAGEGNLVVRAARAFAGATGVELAIAVHLEKRIPAGAGLGGGSSDAASTLAALDQVYETELPPDDLAELAAELGSDVPAFLAGPTAFARGRGEAVIPLLPPPPAPVLVVVPVWSTPTSLVYEHAARALGGPRRAAPVRRVAGIWRFEGERSNRLEDVVLSLFPEAARLRDRLAGAGGCPVLLAGSGSAFALFPADEEASTLLAGKVSEWPEVRSVHRVHTLSTSWVPEAMMPA
ncbi:MAG: 4-(cytidine 5'-diphospho)-2-C-methyl-D-erythritol kinase [Planctomycetes bacterium]|nr:4-(cytidine 5'-diphospho)-2-C-methyl-D-erythritol kinase [Planctomycetota bacterium]